MQLTQDAGTNALVEAITRAKLSIENGDLEAGLEAFREIAGANPQIPEVFNNLGAICAAMGLREEAETAFGRAAELTPDAANPWYNRGLMRFEGGNNVGALEDFQRAAELDPQDPEIQNNIGVLHFQLRQFNEARASFEQAIQSRPHYIAAELNMADVELALKDVDAATSRCQRLLSVDEDPEISAKLIECCISAAAEHLDQAAEATRRTSALAGESLDLADQLGRIVRAKQVLLNEDIFAATATADTSESNPASLLG
jgi:tetratricopeptide (TPR) repeat protein